MARDCEYFPLIHDDELSRLKARIAELEEERRWRKFSEEKPKEKKRYITQLTRRTLTKEG